MGDIGRPESQTPQNEKLSPFRSMMRKVARVVMEPEVMNDWFDKMGAKVDVPKMIWADSATLMLRARSITESENGIETFDKSRDTFTKDMSYILNSETYKKTHGTTELQKMTREAYGKVSGQLVDLSADAYDDGIRNIIKGTAWSMIASDADKVLTKSGSQPISPEWKSNLWRIINVKTPDTQLLKSELEKFSKGDPSVFVSPVKT
ncbi:MAG TPA: hypothetical protein VKC53_03680 [Patescibacteria group bacterium]|nr:hypothetical protein [Patescibacteria group bacterium]